MKAVENTVFTIHVSSSGFTGVPNLFLERPFDDVWYKSLLHIENISDIHARGSRLRWKEMDLWRAQTMKIRTFPISYVYVSKSYLCYPSVHDLFVLTAKNWGTTDKKHLLITSNTKKLTVSVNTEINNFVHLQGNRYHNRPCLLENLQRVRHWKKIPIISIRF